MAKKIGAVIPTTHGADKHTDRTRKVSLRPRDGISYTYPDGSTVQHYYIGVLPDDYVAGTEIFLGFIGLGGGSGDVYCKANLVYVLTPSTSVYTTTPTNYETFDCGSVDAYREFADGITDANLIAGSYLRVSLTRYGGNVLDTVSADLTIYDLVMRYTADQ